MLVLKVTGSTPETLASTLLIPGALPSVSVVCARPFAFVVALVSERLPPPAVTENVTL